MASRLVPWRASSAAPAGVCDAPNRNAAAAVAGGDEAHRALTQNAQVPSNRTTAVPRAPGRRHHGAAATGRTRGRRHAHGARPADRAHRRARHVVVAVEDVLHRREGLQRLPHGAAGEDVDDAVAARSTSVFRSSSQASSDAAHLQVEGRRCAGRPTPCPTASRPARHLRHRVAFDRRGRHRALELLDVSASCPVIAEGRGERARRPRTRRRRRGSRPSWRAGG